MSDLANKEIQEVFDYVFNRYYIPRLQNGTADIELSIYPNCNLGCKYCYLQTYKDMLYPKELRNKEIIFENMKKFINWIIENKYVLRTLVLFSGEIWHTEYGIQILNYLYLTASKTRFTKAIVIPTNASFARNNVYYNFFKEMLSKFNTVGVTLYLSFSVDGKLIDDKVRPLNNSESYGYDEFYDRLFELKREWPINVGFHPMVSSAAIPYWKENYLWWIEKHKEYDMDLKENIMMLEVRNDDWTDESLHHYEDFLKFILMYRFHNIFNGDKEAFFKSLFYLDHDKCNVTTICEHVDGLSCAIQRQMYVRLGDLAITPCHRLSYNHLNYGHFTQNEEGKISGVKFNNTEFMIKVLTCSPTLTIPKCDKCNYRFLCSHGCLGSQYENMVDPFSPIPSVCKLQKLKTNVILNVTETTSCMGLLLDYLNKNARHSFRKYILGILNSEENSTYAEK